MKFRKKFGPILSVLFVAGCAGNQRSCQNSMNETYGADWVIAQDNATGTPYRCWLVRGQSVVNEDKSDGIHWYDAQTRGMIHISGWYNRVQVMHGDFAGAAKSIDVDISKCHEG